MPRSSSGLGHLDIRNRFELGKSLKLSMSGAMLHGYFKDPKPLPGYH
jgi:hypothetical protein